MSNVSTVLPDRNIHSISGLKVICMFLIFWWHSDLEKPPADLGARGCEFFFLIAGFLFYYAHKQHPIPCNARSIYDYSMRKVSVIWPLHCLTLLLTLTYIKPSIWLSFDGLLMAFLNLSFLHAFINNPSVYHSFNGVSWFCSAIIFCYILAPLFFRMIHTWKKAVFMYFFAFLLRLFIEWVPIIRPGAFWNVNIHVFPPVRCLEFLMGMSCAAILAQIRPLHQPNYWLASLLEIVCLLGTVFITVSKQQIWLRAFFLLPFSLLIFVFSFDVGILSDFFTIGIFHFYSELQLEFFLLHQVVFRIIQKYYPTLYAYPKREFIICLFLTTLISWLYSRYLSKTATRSTKNALILLRHYLEH